jgi:hypothetical protein
LTLACLSRHIVNRSLAIRFNHNSRAVDRSRRQAVTVRSPVAIALAQVDRKWRKTRQNRAEFCALMALRHSEIAGLPVLCVVQYWQVSHRTFGTPLLGAKRNKRLDNGLIANSAARPSAKPSGSREMRGFEQECAETTRKTA